MGMCHQALRQPELLFGYVYSLPKVMIEGTITDYQTVYCGNRYYFTIKFRNGQPDQTASDTAYCGSGYCRGTTVTTYTFSKCTNDNPCESCAAILDAIHSCHRPTTYTDKEGTTDLNGYCGDTWGYEGNDHEMGQPLVIGYGERKTSSDTLEFEIAGTESTKITIRKIWEDNNNSAKKRPDKITVDIYKGDDLYKSVELTEDNKKEDNEWELVVNNLPKYEDGDITKEIVYHIKERKVNNYITTYDGNTITNKYNETDKMVDIPVTKEWDDNNNKDKKRPSEIKVYLMNKSTEVDSATLSEGNEWKHIFTVPKNDENGKEIKYTIKEDVPDKYKATIEDEESTGGYKITNKYIPDEKVTVSGQKIWDDNNNKAGKRPTNITVKLQKDGKTIEEKVVRSPWTYSFSDLPKYTDGIENKYSVIEDPVPDSYEVSYDEYTYNITNTFKSKEKTKITIIKNWDDRGYEWYRPEEITVYVNNGANIVSTVTISGTKTSDIWTETVSGLDKYDSSGNEIQYSIEEKTMHYYIATYDRNYNTYTITNTYQEDPPEQETINVSGIKSWAHGENENKPETIRVHLYKNGNLIRSQNVTSSDNWSYTFENLPKYTYFDNGGYTENVYTVLEDEIANYVPEYNGYYIANTYNPDKITIAGVKSWNDDNDRDGIRPNWVIIDLYRNDTNGVYKSTTASVYDGWRFSFENLDKYYTIDGDETKYEYEYRVEEETPYGYDSNKFSDRTCTIIQNTHIPEVVNVTVTKRWDDDTDRDGKRSNIRIELYGNGRYITGVTLNKSVYGDEKNEWSYTFRNLYKNEFGREIVYTVKEIPLTGYSQSINGRTIENIHDPEKINIIGQKIWDDDNNRDGIRPNKITVYLSSNADSKVYSIETDASKNWQYAFNGLYKYYNHGKEIQYTVSEEYTITSPNQTDTKYTLTKNGYNMINKHEPDRTSVSVTKTWDDEDDRDGLMPKNIQVTLYANGKKLGSPATLSEANGWSYTFDNLYKYEDGSLITYTVEENQIPGYTETRDPYNPNSITNTHIPEKITISGVKTWDDDNDRDGIRPESIIVKLMDGDVEVRRAIATVSNGWSYSFVDEYKYKNHGQLINYTIEEEIPSGYTFNTNGEYNIKNTHEPVRIDISGSKTWNDENDLDEIRASSITVNLMNRGTVVATTTTDASKNWSYSFENVFKYEDHGKIINYYVEEVGVDSRYTTTYNGFNMTNTHVPKKFDLSLRKYITAVNGEAPEISRVPQPNTTPLNGSETTAYYNHTKDTLSVGIGDLITYTIRVYNEGERVGYVTEIKDHLPSNLEYVADDPTNIKYGWTASGNTATTKYLQNRKLSEYNGNTLDSDYVQIVCRVKTTAVYNERLVNLAQITGYAYETLKGTKREGIIIDRDSEINNATVLSNMSNYQGNGKVGDYVKGQQDDDDFESVIVNQYIDLSLRKFITSMDGEAPLVVNYKEENIELDEMNREPIAKTDTLKSGELTGVYEHIKDPVPVARESLVEYTIRVYNEGTRDGYALEVTDYIPDHLEYIPDNSTNIANGWVASTENGKTVIRTNKLATTLLEKYHTYGKTDYRSELAYADIKVVCKVKEEAEKYEIIVNVAEISKYACDVKGVSYQIPADRDSRANNITLPENWETGYTGKGGNPNGEYWEGQEDDDDFDRIQVRITEVEGNVWLDGAEGKQEERDGILTDKDKGMAGVRVIAYREKNDGSLVLMRETKTNSNENIVYTRHADGTVTTNIVTTKFDTNSGEYGHYLLKNMLLDYDYVLEFEYPGQEYIPVSEMSNNVTLNDGTSVKAGYVKLGENYTKYNSAAIEKEEDRTALNNRFHEIVNPRNTKEEGIAIDANGTDTIPLRYTYNNNHTSTIIKTPSETIGDGKAINILELENADSNAFINYSKIKANTVKFAGTNEFVKYINLGLVERAQVNLGLMTDIKQVELTINGKSVIYDDENPNADGQLFDLKNEDGAINLATKESDLSVKYNQAIYDSDYNFRIEDYKNDMYTSNYEQRIEGYEGQNIQGVSQSDELEVYVTYKTKIKNYSAKSAAVSELKIYFDKTFEYDKAYAPVKSWYTTKQPAEGATEETAEVEWGGIVEVNDKYNMMTTNSIKEKELAPNQDIYVYVTFRVQKTNDENRKIIVDSGDKYVVSEITGYTTKEGLIDTNSNPNNIDLSNVWDSYVNTFEDDTDRAPGLNLYVKNDLVRTMTGFVWEDSEDANYTRQNDDVKAGNGIFDEGNASKQDGVIVQLIELKKIGDKTYEYIWQETVTGGNEIKYMDRTEATCQTKPIENSKGEYQFTEFIPGDYIVRFIYGQTIKDGKVVLSGQDYKFTTYHEYADNASSAKDNKQRRLIVMQNTQDQTGNMIKILNNTGEDSEWLAANTWMNADTVETMQIGVNDSTPGHKVNFGLITRPISKLTLHEDIAGIKITNKGVRYVDTENGIGSVKDFKKAFMDIDDEIINGAILEVKFRLYVQNESEKDTLYNYFEGDPICGKSEDEQHNPTTAKATAVYNYTNELGLKNPDGWTEIDYMKPESQEDFNKLEDNVQSIIKSTTGMRVFKANLGSELYDEIVPNEQTKDTYITLSRVLSIGATDELVYSDSSEIITGWNRVGRKENESIYGNYEPRTELDSEFPPEPDTSGAEAVVTEPTGKPRPYYELWIAVVALTITGIILIKKFALSKK